MVVLSMGPPEILMLAALTIFGSLVSAAAAAITGLLWARAKATEYRVLFGWGMLGTAFAITLYFALVLLGVDMEDPVFGDLLCNGMAMVSLGVVAGVVIRTKRTALR